MNTRTLQQTCTEPAISERMVLAAALTQPALWVPDLVHRLAPESFGTSTHRHIWRWIAGEHAAQRSPDQVALASHLMTLDSDIAERWGGLGIVAAITEHAYQDEERVEAHLRQVLAGQQRRESIRRAQVLIAMAQDPQVPPEAISSGWQDAARVVEGLNATSETLTAKQILQAAADASEDEQVAREQGLTTRVRTGREDIDHRFGGGFAKGEQTIIAARPSMGKTALAMQIADGAARAGQVVLGFSLEMSQLQLGWRQAGLAGMDTSALREGRLGREEWIRLRDIVDDAPTSLLWSVAPGISLGKVVSTAKAVRREYGRLDMVLVDYLQLMGGQGRTPREQFIGQLSGGLKRLALEMDLAMVVLSQLNRSVESRPTKRPMMSDLRESGTIEQDADRIGFIYRNDYYFPNEVEGRETAEIIWTKSRNDGKLGTDRVWFREGRFGGLVNERAESQARAAGYL